VFAVVYKLLSILHTGFGFSYTFCNYTLFVVFKLQILIEPNGRAGSVWIFQFRFDSVRFSLSSIHFQFFSFDIRTPPQCKRMLVCENTKRGSINFHKKFQLKYIDRPRPV